MKKEDTTSIQFYPLGDAAIVVEFGHSISRQTHAVIQAFATQLAQQPFTGFIEYVPAFTTVTVYYNPWVVSQKGKHNPYDVVLTCLQNLLGELTEQEYWPAPHVVEIPVVYGGKYGPDLEWVAEYNKLTPEEVINLHSVTNYLVYMIGFAPGFPYLGGMNEKIAAPRKEKPRAKIPPGSVGIAGKQTGVYPIQTPGGWQLIGRTPLTLFNPLRESPSLLKAGDMVRFVPVSEKEFDKRKEQEG